MLSRTLGGSIPKTMEYDSGLSVVQFKGSRHPDMPSPFIQRMVPRTRRSKAA